MTPYVDGPSEGGAMDALQIVSADRDVWKERALKAENELREARNREASLQGIVVEIMAVNERIETKSHAAIETLKSLSQTLTTMKEEAGQSVFRRNLK